MAKKKSTPKPAGNRTGNERPVDYWGPTTLVKVARKNNETAETPAWLVPGACGVLAFHKVLNEDGEPVGPDWVLTHVPSGCALRRLQTAEEAEDLGCWLWANVVDQERFALSSEGDVVPAMGTRVHRRLSRQQPATLEYLVKRRKTKQPHLDHALEERYIELLRQVEQTLLKARELTVPLQAKEKQILARETNVRNSEERLQARQLEVEKQCTERKAEADRIAAAANTRLNEANTARNELNRLQSQLIQAIVAIVPNAAADPTPIQRQLLNIRL